MIAWEYKIVESVDLQGGRLHRLGQTGWELITVLREIANAGGARDKYIFKRVSAIKRTYCPYCQCTGCQANHDPDEGPL